MFEQLTAHRPDRASVVERELRRLLEGVEPAPGVGRIDQGAPEGRGRPGRPPLHAGVDDAGARHAVVARERAFAERAARVDAPVAAGAAQLERARMAQGELARTAAARRRAGPVPAAA